MNKPTRAARPSVNPTQVESAVATLKAAVADGSAVTLIDGIGMTFKVAPAIAEMMIARGYRRA